MTPQARLMTPQAGPVTPAAGPMTLTARAADALLEASVVGSFTRIGLAVRSRLLPEFTEDQRPPMPGQVAIVTGATSGIGRAAATELARRGAAVHFLARDEGRAARAQREMAEATGSRAVSYGLADLEDLDSVRAFAREFRAGHDRLDVLIHNAGAIHPDFQASGTGTELTVAGQVHAPFLLTQLLRPALLAAAPSRVITVSSAGMYTQRLDPATLQMTASGYNGVTAYARAKRAQVALSREWARRFPAGDVAFHAMHPGWADTPGLATMLPGFHRVMQPLLRTPGQGADTLIWLASADPARLGSGLFWFDRRPRSEYRLPRTREAGPEVARRLWESIAELVPA
jgi:dehydrogenase/reductase SDR family member 12